MYISPSADSFQSRDRVSSLFKMGQYFAVQGIPFCFNLGIEYLLFSRAVATVVASASLHVSISESSIFSFQVLLTFKHNLIAQRFQSRNRVSSLFKTRHPLPKRLTFHQVSISESSIFSFQATSISNSDRSSSSFQSRNRVSSLFKFSFDYDTTGVDETSFNLVIEYLLFSSFRASRCRSLEERHRFNLVIEYLLFSSTEKKITDLTTAKFQSRNRVSSLFKSC